MKKSQRGGPGAGSRLFGTLLVGDPRWRIAIMVGLFVVLVAIVVGLNVYSGTEEAQEMGETAPSPEVAGFAGFSGVPAFDQEIADRIADQGPDARRRWENEAIPYLMLEARNTPAVHAYRRNLLPITVGSAAEIEKNSRPWRFKFVRFRGSLDYMREESYEETYKAQDPPLGQIQRGRVHVPGSNVRVVFLTPSIPYWSDPNDVQPELKIIKDGWVRGRAIFVKNFVDSDDVPTLLVVATDIERDYAPVPVTTLDEIPFQIIDDDPSVSNTEVGRILLAKEYPQPLYRLVKYAEPRAGGAGAAQRKADGLVAQELDKKGTYEKLIGQPAQYRTQYFGGLGAIGLEPLEYGPDTITANDAGVEQVLNGWILTDGQKLVQFVAPIELAGDWTQRARIRYEGFFYKTKLYPARNGTDRLAPMFVLTVLEKVDPPTPNRTAQILIAVGFLVGIAALVFLVVREDKTKESYRRQRRKRIAAT